MEEDCKHLLRNNLAPDENVDEEHEIKTQSDVGHHTSSGEGSDNMSSVEDKQTSQSCDTVLKPEPSEVKADNSQVSQGCDKLSLKSSDVMSASSEVKFEFVELQDDSKAAAEQRSGFCVTDIGETASLHQSVCLTDSAYDSASVSNQVGCNQTTSVLPASSAHQGHNAETDCLQCREFLPNLSNFLKQKYSPKLQHDMIYALKREMMAITGFLYGTDSNKDDVGAPERYYYPDDYCLEWTNQPCSLNRTQNAGCYGDVTREKSSVNNCTDQSSYHSTACGCGFHQLTQDKAVISGIGHLNRNRKNLFPDTSDGSSLMLSKSAVSSTPNTQIHSLSCINKRIRSSVEIITSENGSESDNPINAMLDNTCMVSERIGSYNNAVVKSAPGILRGMLDKTSGDSFPPPDVPLLLTAKQLNESLANARNAYAVTSAELRKEKRRVQERHRRAKVKLAFEDLRYLVPGTNRITDNTVLLKHTVNYIKFLQQHIGKKLDKEFTDQTQFTTWKRT